MSKGLGRIQRECLRVIERYEAEGKKPTTFTIVAEVYQIKPDRHGNRMVSDAQHVATKRALASLRRKGLAAGQQDVEVAADGTKTFPHVRQHSDGTYGQRAERCCFWSIVR
jgi:hypothetical protein